MAVVFRGSSLLRKSRVGSTSFRRSKMAGSGGEVEGGTSLRSGVWSSVAMMSSLWVDYFSRLSGGVFGPRVLWPKFGH